MNEPGNMTIVEGDDEVKAWLRAEPRRVDDWTFELVDSTVFHAAGRIRMHAPGQISELVSVDLPNVLSPGLMEGTAGVEPDVREENFLGSTPGNPTVGLGSDPADYPVYVEVGTGIYGPVGEPITSIPGYLMGPITGSDGRPFFTSVVQGQRPQHYTERAFEDTVAWMPGHIELALNDLGKTH